MKYLEHAKQTNKKTNKQKKNPTDLYLKHFKNTFLNFFHNKSENVINLSNIFQNSFQLRCSEVNNGWHEDPCKGRQDALKELNRGFSQDCFLLADTDSKGLWLLSHQ